MATLTFYCREIVNTRCAVIVNGHMWYNDPDKVLCERLLLGGKNSRYENLYSKRII